MPESANTLDMPWFPNSYFVSSACFVKVSIDSFFHVRRNIYFSITWEICALRRIGILVGPKCQSCHCYREILIFQLNLFENFGFEFSQILNWRCYIFRWLLDGTTSDFVPLIEVLIGWTCEKVQSIFLSVFILISLNLPAWLLPTGSPSISFCQ